jgi:hypothetical protein
MTESIARTPPAEGLSALGLIVIVSIGILVAILRSSSAYLMKGAVRRLAGRLGGQVVSQGVFGDPSLKFAVRGREAWLETRRGGLFRRPFARVLINVVDLFPGVLHIVPQGTGQEFLQLFSQNDLLIGDPDFDRQYVIKAKPESLVMTLFQPDRRAEVMSAVRRLRGYPAPKISLDRVNLTVEVGRYPPETETLMVLVSVATDLFRCLSAPPKAVGIQIEEVRTFSGGECPVCGSTMTRNTVRCEVCRTPHHRECWAYMGRCSTYACKGTRGVA